MTDTPSEPRPPAPGLNMPSLTEGLETPAPRRPGKQGSRGAPLGRSIAAFLDRSGKPIGLTLAALGLVVGATLAYDALKPIRPPDPWRAPLDDVLGFALLDADFNRLPLERRLDLAKEIVARLRSMSAQDSVLMAAFAAGISGVARQRLEDNMSRLMVDLFDSFAKTYAAASDADKERVIEESLLAMLELQRDLDPVGVTGERDARDRLDQLRERTTARERAAAGDSRPTSIEPGRAEDILRRVEQGVADRTSPAERARTVRFMRDTVRYLRGRDVATGRPAD